MIPELLKDNTTIIKNHTIKTYIYCVLLRIMIGLFVVTDKIPLDVLKLLCLFVIIFFTYKFLKITHIWKVYLRTILSYAIVLFLITNYNNKYNSVAGTIIIIDALMGVQSEHIFDKIGFLLSK